MEVPQEWEQILSDLAALEFENAELRRMLAERDSITEAES